MTKIEKMLQYISENNVFYKNIIKDYGITNPLDISQYPVLTRKQLQENRYNIFSNGYKSKYLNFQLRRHTSSGTTGIPINVYWDQHDYMQSVLSLWRKRFEWYGVIAQDRYITFTLPYMIKEDISESILYQENGNELFVNAASLTSAEKYKTLIEKIACFKPKWLYIQPFILEQLIYWYKEYDIKPPSSLIYIESVGEILTKELKKISMSFFGVPIANLYGSQEHNGIAYECPYGNMHILEDNVYVEKNAIITNLNNYAYPLIRYDQGDIINLSSSVISCRCGVHTQCIDSIYGRLSQSFKISDFEVSAYLLSEVISYVNNKYNGMIVFYNYIYYVTDMKLECLVRIKNTTGKWEEKIISEIEIELSKRLVNCNGLKIVVKNCNTEIFITTKKQILSVVL